MTADAARNPRVSLLVLLSSLVLPAEGQAGDTAAEAKYAQAVHAAVMVNWVQPATATPGEACMVEINQRPGGEVVQVSFGEPCNADAASRGTMERAVRRASPLPYAGFEPQFRSRITFDFRNDGH